MDQVRDRAGAFLLESLHAAVPPSGRVYHAHSGVLRRPRRGLEPLRSPGRVV
jgi:hypothetical protein